MSDDEKKPAEESLADIGKRLADATKPLAESLAVMGKQVSEVTQPLRAQLAEAGKEMAEATTQLEETIKRTIDAISPLANIRQSLQSAHVGIAPELLESLRKSSEPLITESSLFETFVNPHLASEFTRRLVKLVNEFNDNLDQEHEVGLKLVAYGQIEMIYVSSIGYWNPSLIIFGGYREDGTPVQLVQHVSQISFLMVKAKRLDPSKPKRPIGFTVEETA